MFGYMQAVSKSAAHVWIYAHSIRSAAKVQMISGSAKVPLKIN
jgi:hypothetical protein